MLDIDNYKTYNLDCGYFSPLLNKEGLFARETYTGKELKLKFSQFIIISQRDVDACRKILHEMPEVTAIYLNRSSKEGRGLIAIASPHTEEVCEKLRAGNHDDTFRLGYPSEGSLFELIAEYEKRDLSQLQPGDVVTITAEGIEWLRIKGFLESLPAMTGIIDYVRKTSSLVLFEEGSRGKRVSVKNEYLVRLLKNEDSPC